jgi:hypothetical protein
MSVCEKGFTKEIQMSRSNKVVNLGEVCFLVEGTGVEPRSVVGAPYARQLLRRGPAPL